MALIPGLVANNPGVVSLASIANTVRLRCDMLQTQFVTDTELYGYINSSTQELYDMLLEAYGEDYYFQTSSSFTTDGVNQFYPLPPDFYKGFGVDLSTNVQNPNAWVTLKPFNFGERNRFYPYGTQPWVGYGSTPLKYRYEGNQIWLTPLPAANQIIRVWYAPRFYPLQNAISGSTNIALQSQTLNTSPWVQNGNTVVQAAGTAPDGSATACQITCTAGSALHTTVQAITLPNGNTVYTASVFLQAGTVNYCGVAVQTPSGGLTHSIVVNLSTGKAFDPQNVINYGLDNYGNGWYRAWVIFNAGAFVTNAAALILSPGATQTNADLFGANQTVWTAQGTETVFVWGAQLENDSGANLYSATTTASVATANDPNSTPTLFDGVNGWDEYIVTDVAIKVLTKEESDPSVFVAQKAALQTRINDIKFNRDIGMPGTVVDSQAAERPWGSLYPGGGGGYVGGF